METEPKWEIESKWQNDDEEKALSKYEQVQYKIHPKWILRFLMCDLLACFVLTIIAFTARLKNYANWSSDRNCYLKSTESTLEGYWLLAGGIPIMLIYRIIIDEEMRNYKFTEIGQFLFMPFLTLVNIIASGVANPSYVPLVFVECFFFIFLQATLGQCSVFTDKCESRLMCFLCIPVTLLYFVDRWSMQLECKNLTVLSLIGSKINVFCLFLLVVRAVELALHKLKYPKKNLFYRIMGSYSNSMANEGRIVPVEMEFVTKA